MVPEVLGWIDGDVAVLVVGTLVFLESAALLGLLVPGELALLAAGAAAATGRVSLVGLLASGVVGAVAGEAVGYELGRRWGGRLLERAAGHPRLSGHVPRASRLLVRHGGTAVVLSRWAGVLRALVPLLAGATRMSYPRFAVANVVGSIAWVGILSVGGYLAARSVDRVAGWLGWAGAIAVASLLILAAASTVRGRLSRAWVTTGWAIGSVGLGAGAFALLLRFTGADLGQLVSSLRPGTLAAVVALELASLVALVQVYRATYRSTGGSIGFRDAATIAMGAFGLAQVVPGGGAVGSVFAARQLSRRHGADAVAASATVVLFGVVTMATLGLLASVAATVASVASPRYVRYALLSAAVSGAVVVVLAIMRRSLDHAGVRRRLSDLLSRVAAEEEACRDGWSAAIQRQADLLRRPGRLLASAGWSAVNWSLDIAVLGLLAVAAGTQVPVLAVVVAYGVANLANGIPITPGGIGIVETGMVGTLVVFGADPASASVAVISYRLLAHWLPLALAGPVVLVGLRRGRSAVPT